MVRYIVRRLIHSIPLLIGITIIAFALIHVSGDPMAVYNNNPRMSPEARAAIAAKYGFDKPMYVQYFVWLSRLVQGDLGYSFSTFEPVSTMIAQRLPNSLILMGAALCITLMAAIPAGIYSAVKQYSWGDHLITGLAFFAFALPTFWLGLLTIMLFSVKFKQWGLPSLPAGGMYDVSVGKTFGQVLHHLILPASILGLVSAASYIRYLRASLLEVLSQDYMRTARAKGLSERTMLFRHAIKNALIPVVTLAMMDIPWLFAGALITEQVFAWPGMGRLFWEHAMKVDYPVLMGIIVIVSSLVVLCNLLADILYAMLDPRIRFG